MHNSNALFAASLTLVCIPTESPVRMKLLEHKTTFVKIDLPETKTRLYAEISK